MVRPSKNQLGPMAFQVLTVKQNNWTGNPTLGDVSTKKSTNSLASYSVSNYYLRGLCCSHVLLITGSQMDTGSLFTFINRDTHNLITSSWVQGAPVATTHWCEANMTPPAEERLWWGEPGLDLDPFQSALNPPLLCGVSSYSSTFRYSHFISEKEKGARRREGRREGSSTQFLLRQK